MQEHCKRGGFALESASIRAARGAWCSGTCWSAESTRAPAIGRRSASAPRGPDFHREEVRGRQHASVSTEEFLPGRPSLALRRRLDPVLLQNAGDGATADVVMQVGKRPLDPGVAPRAVLRRHPDNPLANPAATGGRPGPRRFWPSYFRAISVRCHASKVSGVTIDRISCSTRRPSVWAFAARRIR